MAYRHCPGTRESQLNPAEASLALTSCHDTSDLLFENLGALAWADYCKGREDRDEIPVHRHLRLTVSDYSRTRTTQFSYAEVTGITKGRPEDLFEPLESRLENNSLPTILKKMVNISVRR